MLPAVISPFALRKIGESAARRYFVTGERFDGEIARRIGLVHEVTTDLDSCARPLLGELRTAGPRASRHAKRLVLDRPDGPETARRIAERRTSDEGQAGLRAFIEGTPPPWAPPARDRSLTALLALISAVFIGSADFIGGLTSRTANGVRVATFVSIVGVPLALAVSVAYGADRVTTDMVWSVLSGVAVGVGHRVLLHRHGSRAHQHRRARRRCHRRGGTGRVRTRKRRAARDDDADRARRRDRRGGRRLARTVRAARRAGGVDATVIALALASGLFFGLFYIAFSRVSDDAGLWPVTIARSAAALVLVVLALALTRGPIDGLRRSRSHRARDRRPRGRGDGAAAPRAAARPGGDRLGDRVPLPRHDRVLAGIVLHERLSRLQYVGRRVRARLRRPRLDGVVRPAA